MKIRCKECGKRFDDELYNGVCPKCGYYIYMAVPETSENENCEIEGSHIHVESGYTATYRQEDLYTESYSEGEARAYAQPERKKPSAAAVTKILVASIILVGIVSMGLAMVSQKRAHEAMTVKEEISVKTQQADEPITYMAKSNRYDIYIDLVKVDKNPIYEIPEEYELISISYRIARTFLGGDGSDYDSFFEISMKPYLETKDGKYLEALSLYKLERLLKTDYDRTTEVAVANSFRHQKGKLFYLVKKQDIRGLYIVSADYNYEKYQWGALREMIRVEGLEVTR